MSLKLLLHKKLFQKALIYYLRASHPLKRTSKKAVIRYFCSLIATPPPFIFFPCFSLQSSTRSESFLPLSFSRSFLALSSPLSFSRSLFFSSFKRSFRQVACSAKGENSQRDYSRLQELESFLKIVSDLIETKQIL